MSDSIGKQNLFSQIPEEVLYSHVSDGAYRLYGALARIVDSQERVGFVLIKTLAKRLKRSESAIKRHMKELVEAGLVVSQQQWVDEHGEYHTYRKPGWRQTANIYTLPMDVQGGSKPEPPVTSEPPRGIKTEPTPGSNTERGPGSKSDLQYESPSKPEPPNTKETPLGNYPLRSVEKLFFREDEIDGELHASRQHDEGKEAVPPPPDTTELLDDLWPERKARRKAS